MSVVTRSSLKSRFGGISLGIYAADPGHLSEAAENAAGWGCDCLHFDVMDGVFVPQMTAGPAFVAALAGPALRDVHLMVGNAVRPVESYIKAGADLISVHAESDGAAAALRAIQAAERPVLAGLALMPETPLSAVKPLLALAPDVILVLSLDPRRNTRPDIPAACARLQELRATTLETAPLLAFDGGVSLDNINEIAASRPDIIVSGSAVFRAADPARAFGEMAAPLSKPAPAGATR